MKYEEIGRRCDRIEKEQSELSSKLQENKSDIDELFDSQGNTKNETEKTTLTKLKAEVESLEEFSRRGNLKMYRIPHSRDSRLEDYDTCTQAVTDVLNSGAGPKQWMTDNVARAHRVGQSRDGQPKPMIVKFNRWKDKMTVKCRQFRDKLERGTKVANGKVTETKRQSSRQPGGTGKWPSSRKANLLWNHDGQTPGPTPKSQQQTTQGPQPTLSLIHISEPTRR